MFVRSRMSIDFTYRKRGTIWDIKANTVTYIDENKVTAQELKDLYGSRIEIISRDNIIEKEKEIPVKKEVKIAEKKKIELPKKKVEFKEKPLGEQSIFEILDEIKKEVKGEEKLTGNKEEKPVHAGADLEIELDAVQPVKVKEGKKEEKPVVIVSKEESKKEGKPLVVTKDEVGDLVLEPLQKEQPKKEEKPKKTTTRKSTGKRGRKPRKSNK